MKRIFILFIAAVTVFSFAACNNLSDGNDGIEEQFSDITDTPEDIPEEYEEPAEEYEDQPDGDPGVFDEELPEDVETFFSAYGIPVPPFYIIIRSDVSFTSSEATYGAFTAYCDQLQACAYSVTEYNSDGVSEVEFTLQNERGDIIIGSLKNGSECEITVYPSNN